MYFLLKIGIFQPAMLVYRSVNLAFRAYTFFLWLVCTDLSRNAHRILKPGGVICSQGECLWLNEVWNRLEGEGKECVVFLTKKTAKETTNTSPSRA